jgi:hypothetical protein
MRRSNNRVRAVVLGVTLATLLAGCADYFARRDTITLDGGNAVATNQITHMVDPWPRASAEKDIAFNGERMQRAIERYRTNRVTPPRGEGTGTSYGAGSEESGGEAPANTTPLGPTVTQAPVK